MKNKLLSSPPFWGGRVGLQFKQAWNLLKQERLFSSIYIIGTALSITMVMVISIVYYIRIANIYPETNRDRMLVVKFASIRNQQEGMSSASLSLVTINTCFSNLKHAETVSIETNPWGEESFVQPSSGGAQIPVSVRFVDNNYWTVFPFQFKNGVPFTKADVQSGIRSAVISETTARKIFGTPDVAGKYFALNFNQYRVAGVVKDPSYAISRTYANIWVPYTLSAAAENAWDTNQALGLNHVYLLAPAKDAVEDVKAEARENVRKYAATFPEGVSFTLNGQPDKHWQSIFRFYSNHNPDFNTVLLIHLLIFLILLAIPAISLSGMIDSRMERRLAECGVRRAFGAPNSLILRQIIGENMLFTLFGGILGLLFSYTILLFARNRIMEMGQVFINIPVEGTEVFFTPGMLLNLPVFGITLLICILLNLLAATVPAWKASRKEIVYSLTSKQ